MKENILVSICCQTYNHVNYIEECLNGFLMQKTNFKFEILLRDDASFDGTTNIVKEYSNKYPDIINPLIYTENQFKKGVSPLLDNIKRAKGKYVAICEGDDYWTDPEKLQKQIDILENDESIGLVHTNYLIYNQSTKKIVDNCKDENKIPIGNIYNELLKSNFIATLTTVVRMSLIDQAMKQLKTQIPSWRIGDYPLWLFISANHKVTYLPIFTATYRVLSESASNSKSKLKKISFYLRVLKIQLYFNKNIKSIKFKILYVYLIFLFSSFKLIIKK